MVAILVDAHMLSQAESLLLSLDDHMALAVSSELFSRIIQAYSEACNLEKSFALYFHLGFKSKVKFENQRMYVITRFELNSNFLRLLFENLKILEHENYSTFKTPQVLFQEKVQLDHGLKIILNLAQLRF